MPTLHVPDDYTTLSEALQEANDGDEILVDPDYEPEGGIVVGVDVTIASAGGEGAPFELPSMLVDASDVTLRWARVSEAATNSTRIGGRDLAYSSGIAVYGGSLDAEGVEITVANGLGIVVLDGSAVLRELTIEGTYSTAVVGTGVEVGATVDIDGCTLRGNAAGLSMGDGEYSFPEATSYSLRIANCTFADSEGGYGGDVLLERVDDAEIVGSQFTHAIPEQVGSVYSSHSQLAIRTSSFDGYRGAYGTISAWDGALLLEDTEVSAFLNPVDSAVGGAMILTDVDLTLRRVTFRTAEADYGAVLYLTAGSILAEDSRFVDGIADGSAMLQLEGVRDARFVRNVFCANRVGGMGAAAAITVENTPLVLLNNVFVGHDSPSGHTVGVFDGAAELTNNTFVGNLGPEGAVHGYGNAELTLVNNLFDANEVAWTRADTSLLAGSYNLVWGSSTSATALSPGTGDVAADPGFVPTFDPSDCDTLPMPDVGSPALDAGDPAISDVDGTRSDIGAFGGPEGDWDPDEEDTAAPDPCGDQDLPDDGIDQDCDGIAATSWVGGGCGCGSARASAWGWLALGPLLLRRRSR